MMKEEKLKYIFFVFSAIILFLMLLVSRDAGITCDEVLHYNQSVSVYNYFYTHGEDQSALHTPGTHLKYYGQSYDNIVTFIIRWFNIENVYGFRHLMSSLAGWLAILITGLFAAWLTGYRAGIFVLFLFAVSPTYLGHSQNNLKDIPFALGYISSVFYTLKFLVSGRKISVRDTIILTASIAFTMSIRAGGALVICYLFLFFILYYFLKYLKDTVFDVVEFRKKFFLIFLVTIISLFLSILLWPYALQNPVKNVLDSYNVMAHFPDTFRQIFEGKVEWSDFMPWYYLPKSMAITIPLVVLTGLILFIFFSKPAFKHDKILQFLFIIFTILFPVVFVIYTKSNLYSSWRQFLFIYPGIILLASLGLFYFYEKLESRYLKWGFLAVLAILALNPLKFMILNHNYSYLYYNQFVGGLKGAYGNYETDYYYVSQTEASKWLINYLKTKKIEGPVKVKATYSVKWLFRNHPEIETSYFRYEERSQSDWDYAIVANRYIPPFQLKNKIWPPKNSIHIIYADDVPIGAVLERKSKDDYYGYLALKRSEYTEAINYFEKALMTDSSDEMIYYNFGAALYNNGEFRKADSVLQKGLELNPGFDLILMYLGNIARSQNRNADAIRYYEKVIQVNRKFFEAYIGLSELMTDSNIMMSRTLLRTCLTMNPRYKPAIMALADTYRKTNPDIARKYDELANSID